MFNKLKAKATEGAAAVKAKVDEKKADMKDKRETKWEGEVINATTGEFHPFETWRDLYEPQKQKGEGGKASDLAEQAEKKLLKKIGDNITKNLVQMLAEVVARLLNAAEKGIISVEPQLANLLNAISAVALTYRFQYKNTKKFAHLRAKATDRVAVTLVAAIEKAAAANQQVPADLDPAAVQALIKGLSAKLQTHLEAKKTEAVAAVKNSPLFQMTGADGEQLDAGVVALQGFLQGYIDQKVGVMLPIAEAAVATMLEVAIKYKAVIEAYAANGAENADYEKVRAELGGQIEAQYTRLNTEVDKYVQSLLLLVAGLSEEGAADAE